MFIIKFNFKLLLMLIAQTNIFGEFDSGSG